MRLRFLVSMTLPWLLVLVPHTAQSESLEKVVLLKCKGRLTLFYRVDQRQERETTEQLFEAEVRYKNNEPHNILVGRVGMSGNILLPCKATDAILFCEQKRDIADFKGSLADTSAKISFSTKVTLNRLTGLMKYEHLSSVEKTEPERGSSRHEEDGLFECQPGSKKLF